MTLEKIVEEIKKYALVETPQTEPLCLEAYVNTCPIRLQIGLPKQSLESLLNDVCDAYDQIDATLETGSWRKKNVDHYEMGYKTSGDILERRIGKEKR